MSASERRATWICLACVVLGAAARLWGFATGDSLWLDELFIVNNLRERSFAGLLQPLDYGQNAPVAWLLMLKTLTELFGDDEVVVRMPSLLASLATLPLAWIVASSTVGRRYAIIPLSVICLSPWVVWQAMQAKQYATDLLVALIILALAIRALREPGRRWFSLGVAGFVGIWLSMPAVFVVSGVGLVLLAGTLDKQPVDRKQLLPLIIIGATWTAAFIFNLALFLRPWSQVDWLYDYWSTGFQPWPIERVADLLWVPHAFARVMGDPCGFLGLHLVAVVPVLVGLFVLRHRAARRKHAQLSLSSAPVLLTLAAALVSGYPFASRLVLFLVPSVMMLFAFGVRTLARSRPQSSRLVHGSAAIVLCVPVGWCLLWLPHGGLPLAVQSEALMVRLAEVHQPGETVLLEHIATHAWRYYQVENVKPIAEIAPAWNGRKRAQEMEKVLAERNEPVIWVVMTQVQRRRAPTLREVFNPSEANDGPLIRFQALYRWLVARDTLWTPLAMLRPAIPPGWTIRLEIHVNGGCLWRLEREGRTELTT